MLIVSQFVQLYTHRQETLLFRLFFSFVDLLITFKISENVMATMGKCIQRGLYSEQNVFNVAYIQN